MTSVPPPTPADTFAQSVNQLLADHDDKRVVVLIDGRSGAGKTTLATRVVDQLNDTGGERPRLVRLDDVYPGWDGLAAGSRILAEQILRPHHPGYRRYDWASGRLAEWVDLRPEQSLVVEGAGAITPDTAPLASLSVWLDIDQATRHQAVRLRDGDTVDQWWDQWAEQELTHIHRHSPQHLADLVLRRRDVS